MATHSSIPAWRIPWTEEPGRLQSIESQRVGDSNNNNVQSAAGGPQDNARWESSITFSGRDLLFHQLSIGVWLCLQAAQGCGCRPPRAGRGRQVAYADKSCPQAEGSPVSGGRSRLSFCSLICYQLLPRRMPS